MATEHHILPTNTRSRCSDRPAPGLVHKHGPGDAAVPSPKRSQGGMEDQELRENQRLGWFKDLKLKPWCSEVLRCFGVLRFCSHLLDPFGGVKQRVNSLLITG